MWEGLHSLTCASTFVSHVTFTTGVCNVCLNATVDLNAVLAVMDNSVLAGVETKSSPPLKQCGVACRSRYW